MSRERIVSFYTADDHFRDNRISSDREQIGKDLSAGMTEVSFVFRCYMKVTSHSLIRMRAPEDVLLADSPKIKR